MGALEQATHPIFSFNYDDGGRSSGRELGQWQAAIDALADDAELQDQLNQRVKSLYVNQSADRYENLLALVRYYKLVIFPATKARHDEGHDDGPRATLAYLALDVIEQELLTMWKWATGSNEENIRRLMSGRVPQLLAQLERFAEHSGQDEDSAALMVGLVDGDYAEHPSGEPFGSGEDGRDARRLLYAVAASLLPAALRESSNNGRNLYYFPWLRLAAAPGSA